jgi:hypothetical protein
VRWIRSRGYADQYVGGEGHLNVFFEMVVVIFAAGFAFVDFFDNEPDIQQAGKGYFFAYLQVDVHDEVILRVTRGA